jgi:epoxide hydrolase 4
MSDSLLAAGLVLIDECYNRRHATSVRYLWMILSAFAALLASPVPATQAPSDPAVDYANQHRVGDIEYREAWFGEGDTRLHYVEAGDGPLIVFYHGFPSTWYSWFDQMEALKDRYRVVAVSALGSQQSGQPDRLEPFKVRRLAKQLDALVHYLNGRERFTLVGHDWGAALAFAYAQAYPHRLNGVIGLSAPPYNLFLDLVSSEPEQQARSQYMQRFRALSLSDIRKNGLGTQITRSAYAGLVGSGDLNAEEADLILRAASDPSAMNGGMNWYRANIGPFAAITDRDRWPRHNRSIKVPALLLWGETDQTFVPAFMDKMPAYAERLEIVKLPGVGHWASIEKPELANAAIETFLATHVAER